MKVFTNMVMKKMMTLFTVIIFFNMNFFLAEVEALQLLKNRKMMENIAKLVAGAANEEEKDIVSVADALCDIQYVLSGAILEFGLADKFSALFEEVQRSNMSKACRTEDEAKATVEHYLKKDGTECYYKEEDGKWLVYRKSDNKTIKSINYSPADLDGIVTKP